MAKTNQKQSHPNPLAAVRPGSPPPNLNQFRKPGFSGPKFTQSFRTQNRGGGGK